MKKIISILLTLMMVILGCGATTTTVSAKSASVSFSKKYINVTVGKTSNLKSLIKNNKKYTITWKSSNKSIATVNKNGVVKVKKKGTCTISAYVKQKKQTIKIKVYGKEKYRTLRVKTVAYCSCRSCSGGYGTQTASGRKAKAGRTIAVDRKVIPLGSKVVIDGHTYIAEDTGVKGNVIDIYMSSHKKTIQYGARYKTVKIYYK